MNKLALLILFSFVCLACIPLVAAQEGNALTDAFSNFGSWITDVTAPATEYVTTHVGETTAITGGIAGTGICAYGWNKVSSAKNTLQSAFNKLKGNSDGLSSEVAKYKTEAEKLQTQLANIPAQIDPTEAINKIKVEAENKQLQITDRLNSALNQIQEKEKRIHDLEVEIKTWKQIKSVP